MNVIKHYCDNCNKEVAKSRELYCVYIKIRLDDVRVPSVNKEICCDCMKELGIVVGEVVEVEKYIENYSYFIGRWFGILKKVFK